MLLSVSCIFFISSVFASFLKWNENRTGGVTLEDPLLNYLPVKNLSSEIFFLEIGTGIICGLDIICTSGKKEIEIFILKFTLICIFKMITLFFVNLEPPKDYVPLKDVVLESLLRVNQEPFAKDLMFSGHTAFMFLCFLNSNYPILHFFLVNLMMIMLLINRVHYTIDLIVGILAAFTANNLIIKCIS